MRTTPTNRRLAAGFLRRGKLLKKAEESLLAFARATRPGYKAGWHHKVLCEKLDKFANGEIKRLIVSMPPRHGKSELVSRCLPAWLLGRNPDVEIIACSYSADLARRMNRDVQRIVTCPAYRQIFPETTLNAKNVRSDADGSWLRNSDLFEIVSYKGVYRSAGIGGGITGMGGKYLIIDDPVSNRQDASSPRIRETLEEWYSSTLRTRLAPGGGILLTMTRWNRNDLAGWLMAKAESDPRADQWEYLKFPAIAENPEPPDQRQPGEALWPEHIPLDELLRAKATNSYDWAAMYQQDPISEGGTEWSDEYFPHEIWFEDWPRDAIVRVVTLDPSKGKSDKHGDYSAVVKLAVDQRFNIYVDADLQRRPIDRLVAEFLDHLREFHPNVYGVETNQFQEVLAVEIEKQARERGLLVPLVMLENMTSKIVRIRSGVGPYLARRRLFFKRHSQGARLLVDQLKEFPNGAHDDGPDALEMAIRVADQLIRGESHGEQVAGTM